LKRSNQTMPFRLAQDSQPAQGPELAEGQLTPSLAAFTFYYDWCILVSGQARRRKA